MNIQQLPYSLERALMQIVLGLLNAWVQKGDHGGPCCGYQGFADLQPESIQTHNIFSAMNVEIYVRHAHYREDILVVCCHFNAQGTVILQITVNLGHQFALNGALDLCEDQLLCRSAYKVSSINDIYVHVEIPSERSIELASNTRKTKSRRTFPTSLHSKCTWKTDLQTNIERIYIKWFHMYVIGNIKYLNVISLMSHEISSWIGLN